MPPAPGPSNYRNPTVQDDDDDDLDDLDDVLASFNQPKSNNPISTAKGRSDPQDELPSAKPPTTSMTQKETGAKTNVDADADDDEDDFEASLAAGMENLLRQLAGQHPPGVMPDLPPKTNTTTAPSNPKPKDTNAAPLSPGEEEDQWQKAIELMLSGEGLAALGLDEKGAKKEVSPAPASGGGVSAIKTEGGSGSGSTAQPTFEETIQKTMESLKQGGKNAPHSGKAGGAGGAGGGVPDLEALLRQLGQDPSALDGLGDGDDDELGGLLDGMMSQLMTKEVLEEPMAELASKYPGYLASPPPNTPPSQLEKYTQQFTLVQQILSTFRKPNYSDEKDGKEIAKLVGDMQDLGGPPQEIMGDLPPGFDLAGLGGEEGCCIM